MADSNASHALSRLNAALTSWAVNGPGGADHCSRSLGKPSLMLWRMASAIERPVTLAVRRTSSSSSVGMAKGYVSLFMEESYTKFMPI